MDEPGVHGVYVSTLLICQPLHCGDYGGLPLKILWAVLDLIAIVVLASGFYLWLAKRNVPFEVRLPAQQTVTDGEASPDLGIEQHRSA